MNKTNSANLKDLSKRFSLHFSAGHFLTLAGLFEKIVENFYEAES
jgi:hypothetical protein